MKEKFAQNQPTGATSFFSAELSAELRTILAEEFGQSIDDDAELQEIGLRLVEFVALKELRKPQAILT